MKYTTLYTLILGLFSIGWTDCPEDFMERMQRPGHSEIQLSKVTISGRVLDESGFPLAGATIQEKETANGAIVFRLSATFPRILRWKDVRPFISR